MFRASFISGFRDFTRHLTSSILRARLINRNLDSLSWRVRSCYVVCRLPARVWLKTLSSLLKQQEHYILHAKNSNRKQGRIQEIQTQVAVAAVVRTQPCVKGAASRGLWDMSPQGGATR